MNGAQFTDRANKALLDSSSLAEQYSHSQILPVHLAISLLNPAPDESKDQQAPAHPSHDAASAPSALPSSPVGPATAGSPGHPNPPARPGRGLPAWLRAPSPPASAFCSEPSPGALLTFWPWGHSLVWTPVPGASSPVASGLFDPALSQEGSLGVRYRTNDLWGGQTGKGQEVLPGS